METTWQSKNGEGNPDYVERGRLKGSEAQAALKNSNKAGVEYVIYSYGTPIAWKSGGVWYVVTEKLSASTTKH